MLRFDTHTSHCGFEEIMDYINYLKPKKTVFTHMTALLDEEKLISKSKNTSIENKKLQGKVTNTFVKGEELFKL